MQLIVFCYTEKNDLPGFLQTKTSSAKRDSSSHLLKQFCSSEAEMWAYVCSFLLNLYKGINFLKNWMQIQKVVLFAILASSWQMCICISWAGQHMTYDLSFRLLIFVCLLAGTHKIDFKFFFQSSQLMMISKNCQAIQMKKRIGKVIKN